MNLIELKDKILQIEIETQNYNNIKNRLTASEKNLTKVKEIFEKNQLELASLKKNSLTNSLKKITHSYEKKLFIKNEEFSKAKYNYEVVLIEYNQLNSNISILNKQLDQRATYLELYNKKFSIIKKQYEHLNPYKSLYLNLNNEKIFLDKLQSILISINNLKLNFENTIEFIEQAEVWGSFGGLAANLDRELKMSKADNSLKQIKIDLQNIKTNLETINIIIKCPINITTEIISADYLSAFSGPKYTIYEKIKTTLKNIKLNLKQTILFENSLNENLEIKKQTIYTEQKSIESKIIDENLFK